MTIKIEEGKFYRTRDGRKVGPMAPVRRPSVYAAVWIWTDASNGNPRCDLGERLWRADGTEHYEPDEESVHDLVAEWADEPTLWRDMTPEQKGTLLLAHHDGKHIQMWDLLMEEWATILTPAWRPDFAYRVKPEPIRQMMTWVSRTTAYHITFETIDDVPDPTTVKFYAI